MRFARIPRKVGSELYLRPDGARDKAILRIDIPKTFVNGTATTAKPQLLLEPVGVTSNAWNTAGTVIGINTPAAFTGDGIWVGVNGAKGFGVTGAGNATFSGTINTPSNISNIGGVGFQFASIALSGASSVFNQANVLVLQSDAGVRITQLNAVSGSSGGRIIGQVTTTLTQSGTAGYTAFQINATETSTGSGTKSLIDCNAGSGGTTQVFNVDNLGGITIGASGTKLKKVLSATASLDYASIAAGAFEDKTITVTGAADGDPVAIAVPNASITDNVLFMGWVSAADTVTIRAQNVGLVTARDPASGTFRATVLKF